MDLRETGGARIGAANATWPFASLIVSNDVLQINASLIGKVAFKPGDVISIEPYSALFSTGIRIRHSVPDYDDLIVFWSFTNPTELIKKIRNTSFEPGAAGHQDLNDEVRLLQTQGAFFLKRPVAIVLFLIWNVLFLSDIIPYALRHRTGFPLGHGAQAALALLLIVSLLTLILKPVQHIVLKEGRSIQDVRRSVFLVMIISAIMLFQLTIFINSHAIAP